jgi:predicted HAD superfamily Cof-like phosphohydrolase
MTTTMHSTEKNNETVDPWEFQKTLMVASDQALPQEPQLNCGAILYGALSLEECAEMLTGLSKAVASAAGTSLHLSSIADHFSMVAQDMTSHSKAIRKVLKSVPVDFVATISEENLDEMVDGTTDLAVVNSGFALSIGVDGAACYREVGVSNLSKRNPHTNVIDKEPDGKWIKGVAFMKPDLKKILLATAAERGTAKN